MSALRPLRALAAALLVSVGLLTAAPARADSVHVVGRGQTLFYIAKQYRTTPDAIRAANDLRPGQLIHPGLALTIPGARAARQALARKDKDPPATRNAAKDKGKSAKAKGKEPEKEAPRGKGKDAKDAKDAKSAKNAKGTKGLKGAKNAKSDDDDDDPADAKGGKGAKSAASASGAKNAKGAKNARDASSAKEAASAKGAKGAKNAGESKVAAATGSFAARPKKPGFVTMLRGTEKLGAQLLTRGQLNRAALPGLTKILRHVASDSKKSVDPRLAYLIGVVSDHFGGRKLHVVSGFRPFSKRQFTPHSNHNLGRAMDFAVEGVPNTVVRDFCRTLRDAGVGYYPNSTFVHLDVRTGKAYWIDYAGPGEAPNYGGKVKPKADESTQDVEGSDESGSSRTQDNAEQPTDSKEDVAGSATKKGPAAKARGLKTPTPKKSDSTTRAVVVPDDPYP